MEAVNDEANGMVDTFQIYLQTLLSQALDSNFLKEIAKENGTSFLSCIFFVSLMSRHLFRRIFLDKRRCCRRPLDLA